MQYIVEVFGHVVTEFENKDKAERYAQRIRQGLWQCNETQEPWIEGILTITRDTQDKERYHICNSDCCDTRTDDDVKVGTRY